MNEKIRLLQAEIRAEIKNIAEAYAMLHTIDNYVRQDKTDIVIGYYLNVLYGLFENLFTRIATNFGNHIHDEAQWHSLLLKRMTLDVDGIRPRVLSDEAYECLNELRRFRHVFRNAYVLQFDAVRLELVLHKAHELEVIYEADMNRFLAFLNDLVVHE